MWAATPSRVCGETDRGVVMRSPCAGDALDPPLWIVLNKTLSLSSSSSSDYPTTGELCLLLQDRPIIKLCAGGGGGQ
jgi:hypothetical protein